MKFTPYKTFLITAVILVAVLNSFAQTEREKGIAFYQQADYENAVKTLKRALKTNSDDFKVLYYLGLAYLKTDEPKDATKVLKKAVELDNKNADAYAALAYSYLLRNDLKEAQETAQSSLKLNPNNAEAHYILGVLSLRRGSFNYAYEQANKTIALNPNFAAAYYLKSVVLINSFAAQTETIVKPAENRYTMLSEAAESLDKFLKFVPNDKQANFLREYLTSLQFFADYYNKPLNNEPINFESAETESTDSTALRITYKPKPSYTKEARRANVSGRVKVLAVFSASGKVEHVLVIQTLGYGLDEQAVRAVKRIKFEPQTKDGKPVTVVKTVVFGFIVYERINY
ncbi:MAG: TonB family protein [Pyrinomonadaceae bacterium]